MLPEPVAQAVTTLELGPVRPKRMATCPLAMLAMSMGMKKGLMRMGERSNRVLDCSSHVARPPMPEPTHVPVCSPATSSALRPESAKARSAPMSANCTKRSRRLASLGSR